MKTSVLTGIGVFIWTIFCLILGNFADDYAMWPFLLWVSPYSGFLAYLIFEQPD